jgi:hypothetical protein
LSRWLKGLIVVSDSVVFVSVEQEAVTNSIAANMWRWKIIVV